MRVVGVKADGTVIVDRGDNPHPLIPKQTRADARWEDLEV
jgi:hypothetical protein